MQAIGGIPAENAVTSLEKGSPFMPALYPFQKKEFSDFYNNHAFQQFTAHFLKFRHKCGILYPMPKELVYDRQTVCRKTTRNHEKKNSG